VSYLLRIEEVLDPKVAVKRSEVVSILILLGFDVNRVGHDGYSKCIDGICH